MLIYTSFVKCLELICIKRYINVIYYYYLFVLSIKDD